MSVKNNNDAFLGIYTLIKPIHFEEVKLKKKNSQNTKATRKRKGKIAY